MIAKLAFVACLAASLFMTGVIWFVQVVHYPLMSRVGGAEFRAYHADHARLTTRVVLVPMVVELITSTWLVFDRPRGLGLPWAVLGLGLAVATWGVTFFLSVPAHDRLALGFDAATHRGLVATNWIRSAAWTGHSALLLVATLRQLD